MDDCDLEKLSVKPGTLSPKFGRNVLDYKVTVASDVAKITISCLTSDSNASYQIIGSEGSKTLPLKEGDVTAIKIEVSAEDGTTKFYRINVNRLSACDASLSNIKLSAGQLVPDFNSTCTRYTSNVACSVCMLSVTATAPDKKTLVKVNGGRSETEISLNIGETTVEIEVTSIDGTNTQLYVINIVRQWLPTMVAFDDPDLAIKFECPVTLGPLYKPISINGSDPKHVFSEPIIELLTRTSKLDPLDETPLDSDWKLVEEKLDKELSAVTVKCVYLYSGCTEKMKLSDLGSHIKNCPVKPITGENDKIEKETCKACSHKVAKDEVEWHSATLCTGKFTNREIKHSYKEHTWEKSLQEVMVGPGSVEDLLHNAEGLIKQYRCSLPKPGQTVRDGNAPTDHLLSATACIACAIKQKPKDAELHFRLGLLMEEQYYAEDMYGLKKQEDVADDFGSLTLNAKETGKEEEIGGICQQRGVDPKAPLSRVLQAIDEEYKSLLESGQSGKADYVQGLYIWKSKQATKDGRAAQAATDQQNPLHQAFLKFQDALSLDQNNALYNVHVGRLLLMQDKPQDALKRLELAVGLKPHLTIARFYLGLAIMQQKSGAGSRAKEAATYLHDGLEKFIELSLAKADSVDNGHPEFDLHSEDLWRDTSVQLFRGFLQLGSMQAKMPREKSMGAEQIFHSCGILTAQNLCNLSARANTYQSMEWILLDCHSHLLELMLKNQSSNTRWIAQRCQQLSALIRCSTLPKNPDVLSLQTKTCQKGVIIQPTNSQALCQLGAAQLAMYDNQPSSAESKASLQSAQLSFRASIAQEGKPIIGGDVPQQLKDQEWWKLKEKVEEEKAEAAKPKPATTKTGAPSRGGVTKPIAARGRGTTAGKVVPARGGKAAPTRGGVANRGKSAPTKTAPTKTAPTRGGPAKTPAKCAPAKGSGTAIAKPQPTTPVNKEEPKVANAVPANTPLNRMSYQPRLGLARVLVRESEDSDEAHMLYNDVITMAPQIHDAYIELADLLIKKEPMKAVDVYSRFPFPETSSFDDAYIHGEIVRILMKNQKFDDPRLERHLIAWGRVMGIGCLEKYVEILESKAKNDLLKNVYAGVNYKDVNDPDLQAFFKFKMWL